MNTLIHEIQITVISDNNMNIAETSCLMDKTVIAINKVNSTLVADLLICRLLIRDWEVRAARMKAGVSQASEEAIALHIAS